MRSVFPMHLRARGHRRLNASRDVSRNKKNTTRGRGFTRWRRWGAQNARTSMLLLACAKGRVGGGRPSPPCRSLWIHVLQSGSYVVKPLSKTRTSAKSINQSLWRVAPAQNADSLVLETFVCGDSETTSLNFLFHFNPSYDRNAGSVARPLDRHKLFTENFRCAASAVLHLAYTAQISCARARITP